MPNQSTITPRVTNIAEAGLSTIKSALGEEVKKVGQSAKSQVTGQYQTQSKPRDKEIETMKKQEDVFKENKGALLEQKKQELVREHHRDILQKDEEWIKREEQKKQQKLELQRKEEEEKKLAGEKDRITDQIEMPGSTKQSKKGGGLMGKLKKGFNLIKFNRTKSKESGKGQGVGG